MQKIHYYSKLFTSLLGPEHRRRRGAGRPRVPRVPLPPGAALRVAVREALRQRRRPRTAALRRD